MPRGVTARRGWRLKKPSNMARLARKLDFQSKLLRLVTDSQRNHILIADTEGRVRFVNATLAKFMETNGEELIGKPLAAAVGPGCGASPR
jgi:transcriptional regulator with PAS, ATPase and Fis domain